MDWIKINQTGDSAVEEDRLLEELIHGTDGYHPSNEENFARFCRFAAERMNIFWRRVHDRTLGSKAVWTDDEVLQEYKFTNCYRILDKVSQYLIREISNRFYSQNLQERLYLRFGQTYLFRMFNSIETWENIPKAFLRPVNDLTQARPTFQDAEWPLEQLEKWVLARHAQNLPCFGNAYLMAPPDGKIFTTRIGLYLAAFREILPYWSEIMLAKDLSVSYNLLRKIQGFGDFLAFQFAMDFAYGTQQEMDMSSFVVPGPGCIRGMEKVFGPVDKKKMPSILKALYRHQTDLFKEFKVRFQFLEIADRVFYLQACDFQNLFCEFDKYSRVKYPEMVAQKPRKIIKNQFVPTTHEPLRWILPNSWLFFGQRDLRRKELMPEIRS